MSAVREADDYGVNCWELNDTDLVKQAERHLEDTGHWPHGHIVAVLVDRLKSRIEKNEI